MDFICRLFEFRVVGLLDETSLLVEGSAGLFLDGFEVVLIEGLGGREFNEIAEFEEEIVDKEFV